MLVPFDVTQGRESLDRELGAERLVEWPFHNLRRHGGGLEKGPPVPGKPCDRFWTKVMKRFILIASLSLTWGFNIPAMKIVLSEVPPWTFRLYCTVFGGIGFIILIKSLGISMKIPRQELKPLLFVSFINITLWCILSAYGIAMMNAGRAAIIAYTMPVWATILSVYFLKERLTFRCLAGLFLGIAGIIILIGPDIILVKTAPTGAIFMLGGAISLGAGVVAVKYYRWSMPTILLACWQVILGGIPLVAGAIIIEPTAIFAPVSSRCVLALAYVILVANIFSYWAWFKIISLFPASVASIGILLTPIIGVFSSGLILGEPVGFREIAALILVVLSIVIVFVLPELFRNKSIYTL